MKVPRSEKALIERIGAVQASAVVCNSSGEAIFARGHQRTNVPIPFKPGYAFDTYEVIRARMAREERQRLKSGGRAPMLLQPRGKSLEPIRVGGEALRGVVCSFRKVPPYLIGTDRLPGGWGWFLLTSRFHRAPSLLPIALNLEDVLIQSCTGVAQTVCTDQKLDRRAFRTWTPSDGERELVAHAIARLRSCADAFLACKNITGQDDTLADGCRHVLKNLDVVESELAKAKPKPTRRSAPQSRKGAVSRKGAPSREGVAPRRRSKRSVWPDAALGDEDAIAAAVCAAYPPGKYTMRSLRKLLQRGDRHRTPKSYQFAPGVPKLLREFLAECKPSKRGLTLERGVPFFPDDDVELEGGPWFMVFGVGNGDFWICNRARSSVAHYVDHEGGTHFLDSTGLALGALLAAWLFNDEVASRGLVDHPDCTAHAHELCPVEGYWSVFPHMSL